MTVARTSPQTVSTTIFNRLNEKTPHRAVFFLIGNMDDRQYSPRISPVARAVARHQHKNERHRKCSDAHFLHFKFVYQLNNPTIAADINDTRIPDTKINGTLAAISSAFSRLTKLLYEPIIIPNVPKLAKLVTNTVKTARA